MEPFAQPSPEDLPHSDDFHEAPGPPEYSINNLCEDHPALVKRLVKFERSSAIRLIASLETIPDLLDNTLLIEALLHLAVKCCHGTKKATISDLQIWVADIRNSPIALQEDPPEDAFVGYICTRNGGFRVFGGIYSHVDFILERLLIFLGEKIDFPSFGDAYASVLELLKLSESVASDLNLIRYSVGNPSIESLSLPTADELECHANAIYFDTSRLDILGITDAKLVPFIFDLTKIEELGSAPLFGSPLEKRPLIRAPSGLIIASPTSLCRAAITHVLEVAPNLGGWANTFFEKESAEFFCNRILKRIGITLEVDFRLPSPPPNLPPLYAVIGQFDYGMPVLALTMTSPLTQGSDLEEVESFSDEQSVDLARYISNCCTACENINGFKGGMVLLAFSTIGKPIGFGLGDINPGWRFYSADLADWQTLTFDHDFSAKRLWYLSEQENLAEKANIKILNFSGLLNLYGMWKHQNFALQPLNMHPRNLHNMLVIEGNFAQKINVELKTIRDRHCRLFVDGITWVELHRQEAGLNPDLSTNHVYYDYETAGAGLLRSCIEYGNVCWWIDSVHRPKSPSALNLVFRLWECVCNWAERVLFSLEKEHRDEISSNLKLELYFPNADNWNLSTIPASTSELGDLTLTIDRHSKSARLVFEEGFMNKFYRPDNLAESKIVSVLIAAAVEISEANISNAEIEKLILKITKDKNSRFFHVIQASTLESVIASPENAKPVMIPEEETARIGVGLAYTVDDNPPKKITDADEARIFLDKVVAGIQARLSSRLKQFWILPVVSYSFSQLDELSKSGSRWSLSTRSLLSLEDRADWLRERLRNESGRLALTEITNRALIETAVYSYSPETKEIISQTQHASLLAELAVMIELANYRDAVAAGFVESNITIHPNGVIEYADSFQQEVVQPYLKSRIDDKIQWDADAYDENFDVSDDRDEEAVVECPREEVPEIAAFQKAFCAEFGFPYDALSKIIEIFTGFAIKCGDGGGTLESLLFMSLLKKGGGLSEPQVESFINRFVLPIRPAWNKNLPKGCDINDVLPWRYFRGLSVLVRPFVEISRSPRQFAISAPHLHRWHRYLSQSISQGHLPERLFKSEEMKRYLGSVAHRKGHEFAKNVAEVVAETLPDLKVEIKMSALGAPQSPDLGDIDILAWSPRGKIVFLIECKRLKTALTVRQVIQQLEEFRGDPTNSQDSLVKHQRRVDWLKNNPFGVAKLTGISPELIRWKPLLVTSGRVPMSYLDAIEFSRDQVVPFQDLATQLPKVIKDAEKGT
ncbi:hypothetical protein [Prosthecobacter sp.]|uniref:hypothetical protein n=1 Tax=Prosthecobacter sp. TaxID=1965333 RepID=UPI0037830E3F